MPLGHVGLATSQDPCLLSPLRASLGKKPASGLAGWKLLVVCCSLEGTSGMFIDHLRGDEVSRPCVASVFPPLKWNYQDTILL